MSYYICADCGHKEYIFGTEGGIKTARNMGVPLLGQIPIESAVTRAGDEGEPIVSANPDTASAKAYIEIASKIVKQNFFSF